MSSFYQRPVSVRAGGKAPKERKKKATDSRVCKQKRDRIDLGDKAFVVTHLVHCLISHLFQVSAAGTAAVNQGPQGGRAAVPFTPIANRQEQLPLIRRSNVAFFVR